MKIIPESLAPMLSTLGMAVSVLLAAAVLLSVVLALSTLVSRRFTRLSDRRFRKQLLSGLHAIREDSVEGGPSFHLTTYLQHCIYMDRVPTLRGWQEYVEDFGFPRSATDLAERRRRAVRQQWNSAKSVDATSGVDIDAVHRKGGKA